MKHSTSVSGSLAQSCATVVLASHWKPASFQRVAVTSKASLSRHGQPRAWHTPANTGSASLCDSHAARRAPEATPNGTVPVVVPVVVGMAQLGSRRPVPSG